LEKEEEEDKEKKDKEKHYKKITYYRQTQSDNNIKNLLVIQIYHRLPMIKFFNVKWLTMNFTIESQNPSIITDDHKLLTNSSVIRNFLVAVSYLSKYLIIITIYWYIDEVIMLS